MGPLIYLRDQDKYTLTLGLQRFQGVQGNVQYHYMMAVAVLTVLPIIIMFFFAQQYFVRGHGDDGHQRLKNETPTLLC